MGRAGHHEEHPIRQRISKKLSLGCLDERIGSKTTQSQKRRMDEGNENVDRHSSSYRSFRASISVVFCEYGRFQTASVEVRNSVVSFEPALERVSLDT